MAVLSNISVGDIFYYVVDDFPTHTAPKGSVSLFRSEQYQGILMYVNNDGGNTWLKIISPAYGILSVSGYDTTVDFDSQTVGSWYSWNGDATYTLGQSSGFSRQVDGTFGDFIRYDGSSLIRVFSKMSCTNRAGSTKWCHWNIGVAKNFIIPTEYNGFFTNDNAATNGAGSHRILEMNTNDGVSSAISPVSRETGGGPTSRDYIPRHCSISVYKIDEAVSQESFSENWESGDFTSGGWTVVNGSDYFELVWSGSSGDGDVTINGTPLPTSFDISINNTALGFTKQSFPVGVTAVYQGANVVHIFGASTVTYTQTTANLQVAITEFTAETNLWVVGLAQNNTSGGSYSAYVSDDGGTNASYTITAASVAHFYKDFTFSSNSTIYLEFDWKCQGENTAGNAVQYDYGTVVITDTGTTPVPGTEVSTTQATAGGNGRIGAAANNGKFNLGYGTNPGTTWNTETIDLTSYAGSTKRIVFTWRNDGSVGTDPPFIVDNIRIVEYKW